MTTYLDEAFPADLLKTKVWALSILDVGATDITREFAKSRDARTTALRTVSATPGTRTDAGPASPTVAAWRPANRR
jgi:hypothetical protein